MERIIGSDIRDYIQCKILKSFELFFLFHWLYMYNYLNKLYLFCILFCLIRRGYYMAGGDTKFFLEC